MRLDPKKPHQLVYSLSYEEGFGYLINGFIFQLGEGGHLTLQHQRVNPTNLVDFPEFDNEHNREILTIIEELSSSAMAKRFSKKPIKPNEFIKKFCTPENLEKYIQPYIEIRISKIFDLLKGQKIYQRLRDNPAEIPFNIEFKAAKATFNFHRHENGTKYYLNLSHNNTYLNISECNCKLLANDGAWILVGNTIYHFENDLEGKRLLPFFDKEKVEIAKKSEKAYYQKFVKLTAEKFSVNFSGVATHSHKLDPSFKISVVKDHKNKVSVKSQYQNHLIDIDSKKQRIVHIASKLDDFDVIAYERNWEKEEEIIAKLKALGFYYVKNARFELSSEINLLAFLGEVKATLKEFKAEIQLIDFEEDIYICKPEFSVDLKDTQDWFDVKTKIKFGEFEISFLKIRKNIIEKNPYFKLPNGKVALIPEEWFEQFRYLFTFSESNGDDIILKKQFANLVDDTKGINFSGNERSKEIEPSVFLNEELSNTLRDYQKEGFNWLVNLKDSGFSGVLADDMGLGKTLQTIALLEGVYQNAINSEPSAQQIDLFTYSTIDVKPTLIVVPSSLVFNWAAELRRFAPTLKFFIHYGVNRSQDQILFKRHHIVITTYGLVRNDFDFLSKIDFEYLILDESQNIKNPLAKVTKKVNQLKSNHRIALTGTPIENSLSDLWSQMNFVNKGLLGSYTFFKSEFVTPIEKNASEDQKEKLKKLVYPFILRRTKEQVAKELPPLTEQTLVCEMTADQKKLYEKVKSKYRNLILDASTMLDRKARFAILKGLTELRLIANHPKIYDKELDISSGKFDEISERLLEIHETNHKILVFSQFTRHLEIFRTYLEGKKIKFSMLTGATTNRQEAVESFTKDDNCNVFLISLKAGGVGLNLTKADYVFLLDPWWNPFAEKQAIDRAYRIGQVNNVFSYKFITKDTIEEKILSMQKRKKELAGEFIPVGSKNGFEFNQEDLKELFS